MNEALYEGSTSGQQRKDVTLTYFWQGETATVKEKGRNAMLTVNWGQKQVENKESVGQIRVPMVTLFSTSICFSKYLASQKISIYSHFLKT